MVDKSENIILTLAVNFKYLPFASLAVAAAKTAAKMAIIPLNIL